MQTVFPHPIESGYTIYTKRNCPYCTKVKLLLDSETPTYINCDSFLVAPEMKDRFLAFICEVAGRPYATFPMVFHNGVFIGGYSDTVEILRKEEAFDDLE